MPAIPRSEPFAEQACPLGACDGSGWSLGPEDGARARGVPSATPPRSRGVSFDRPPVSDMARDLETKGAVAAVRSFIDELDERIDSGRGLGLFGDPATVKPTLAMLISKAALEAGCSVAMCSPRKLLRRIRRTYDAEPGGDS